MYCPVTRQQAATVQVVEEGQRLCWWVATLAIAAEGYFQALDHGQDAFVHEAPRPGGRVPQQDAVAVATNFILGLKLYLGGSGRRLG